MQKAGLSLEEINKNFEKIQNDLNAQSWKEIGLNTFEKLSKIALVLATLYLLHRIGLLSILLNSIKNILINPSNKFCPNICIRNNANVTPPSIPLQL